MISRLPPRAAVETPAGTVTAPDFFDPFSPPFPEERRTLYDHMHTVGLPVERWEEWGRIINVEKVSQINTLTKLLAVWAWLSAWQLEHGNETPPTCPMGLNIYEQVRSGSAKIKLPQTQAALF